MPIESKLVKVRAPKGSMDERKMLLKLPNGWPAVLDLLAQAEGVSTTEWVRRRIREGMLRQCAGNPDISEWVLGLLEED